jgi:hypothetical protein
MLSEIQLSALGQGRYARLPGEEPSRPLSAVWGAFESDKKWYESARALVTSLVFSILLCAVC